MPDLERTLVELGRGLSWPETPALASRVRARLAARRPSRRLALPERRTLALAFALLAVAVGAVMAVPQTRAAILEFLGLRSVAIERVEELPTVPRESDLGLGSPVEIDEVEVPWEIVVPAELGEPDAVYYRPDPPGGMVSLLYGTEQAPQAILTQFQATVDDVVAKKLATVTRVEQVLVDGEPGLWLSGAPHVFLYLDRTGNVREETVRLAGNVLLWERGSLTLRLEADVSRAEALAIARSATAR
jgi:hypothetical protein